MPIKKRLSKARRFPVSPEAAARYREVGPGALAHNCILDETLARELGLLPLIAYPPDDMVEIRQALDDAGGRGAR